MTPFWIGIILIAGGVAFAASPLLRRRRRESEAEEPPVELQRMAEPEGHATGVPSSQHDEPRLPADSSVAIALEELELDRAMGKMSDDDYRDLRAALERQAHAATPEPPTALSAEGWSSPDALSQESAPAAAIDASRSLADRDLEGEAERPVQALRATVTNCPDCGPRPEPQAVYCSNCGMALVACPQCARPIAQPGARFCDRCGTALTR